MLHKFRIKNLETNEVFIPYDITFMNPTGLPARYSIVHPDFSISIHNWGDNLELQPLVPVDYDLDVYVGDVIVTKSDMLLVLEDVLMGWFDVYDYDEIEKIDIKEINPKEIKCIDYHHAEVGDEVLDVYSYLNGTGINVVFADKTVKL